jgi:diaminopimelate decarboxylase
MRERLSADEMQKVFRAAMLQGLIREEDTAVMFHDLAFLEERIRRLIGIFPPKTLHALAVKANPLVRIMEFTRDISPFAGVEAASIGEVELALHAGFPPDRIVYDSPVKTVPELAFALKTGVHLNADNLSELERIGLLIAGGSGHGAIGIRINPQVGTGTIAESSVAGEYSKFGVPIKTKRKELLNAFQNYSWLTGVHLHVGSQGCKPELLLEGIGVLYDFVQHINHDAGCQMPDASGRIKQFDIGGGFPISYRASETPPSIETFAAEIKARFPSLSTLHSSLITEFGRWTFTNCGFTASRTEYVKHDPGINTAMIHTGADLFVRECLNPKDWQHDYTVLDRNGNLKTGSSKDPWNLAGPLCFSGDILAKGLTLPDIKEGDYILIHDTGGYTFSMWSRYNSRFAPRILGYGSNGFEILRERENTDDLLRFWG